MNLLTRALLTVAAIQYGVIPPLIDFTETHVFHPEWPPHARFHLVWCLTLGGLLSGYVIFLTWRRPSAHPQALRVASMVGCAVLGAFFVAAATTSAYGGSLSDQAEPLRLLGIDANVLSFTVASIFQLAGTLRVWRAPGEPRPVV